MSWVFLVFNFFICIVSFVFVLVSFNFLGVIIYKKNFSKLYNKLIKYLLILVLGNCVISLLGYVYYWMLKDSLRMWVNKIVVIIK